MQVKKLGSQNIMTSQLRVWAVWVWVNFVVNKMIRILYKQ